MHTKANPRLTKKARAPESVQLSQVSLDSNSLIAETAQPSAYPKKRHKHVDTKDPHDASTNTDVDVLLDTEAPPTKSLRDKSAIIQSWHVAETATGNHSRMVDGIPSASAWPSYYGIFGGLAAVGIGTLALSSGGGNDNVDSGGGGDSVGGNYALDFSDFCASMDAKNYSPQTILGQAADSSIGSIRMHVSGGFDGGLIPLNLNQTLPQYQYSYSNGNVTRGNIDAKGLAWNITDGNVAQASFTLSTDVTASNSRHLWLEELSIKSDSDLSTLEVNAYIIASAANQGNAGIGICDANIDIHATESATANLLIAAHATGNAAANILIHDLHVNVSASGTDWHAEAYANITNFEATANIDADAVISIGNLSLEAYAYGGTESIDAVVQIGTSVATGTHTTQHLYVSRNTHTVSTTTTNYITHTNFIPGFTTFGSPYSLPSYTYPDQLHFHTNTHQIYATETNTFTDYTYQGITASASGDGASAHVTIDDINLKAQAIGLEVTGDISAEANLYSVKAKADAGGDAEVAIGHIAISATASGSAEDKVDAYAGISWTLSANAKEGATALIDIGQIDIKVHATNSGSGTVSADASVYKISAFAEDDANASIYIEDINVFAYANQTNVTGDYVSLDVSIDNIVAKASGDFADAQIDIGDIRLYGTGIGQNEVDVSVSLANISAIASGSYANASIHIDSIFLRTMGRNETNTNNATSVGATASMEQIHAFATFSSELVGAKARIDIGDINILAEAYNALGDTATAYAVLSNTIYANASGSGNASIEIGDMYISAYAEAGDVVFATASMGQDTTVIYAKANDEANASIVIGNIDLIADAIGGNEGNAAALMGLQKNSVTASSSGSAIYAGATLSANAHIDIGNINLDAEISITGSSSAEAFAVMGRVHANAGDKATADIRIDNITLSAKALAPSSAEALAVLTRVSANASTLAVALVDIKDIYIHANASITTSSGDSATAIAWMGSLDQGNTGIFAGALGGSLLLGGAEANINIDDIDILAEAFGSGSDHLSADARIGRIKAVASGDSFNEALIDIGHINITASADIDNGSSSVYALASLGVVEAYANLGLADVVIDEITINANINATGNSGYAQARAFMRGVSANAAIGGSADISIQDINLSAHIAAVLSNVSSASARAEFNFILAEADAGNATISIQDIHVKAYASGASSLTVSAIMGSDDSDDIAIRASAIAGDAHISIGNLSFSAEARGESSVTAYAGISYFIEATSVVGGGDASIMIGNIHADAHATGINHVQASAYLGWFNDAPDGVIRAYADSAGNAEVHITGNINMEATALGNLDMDAYAYISSIQAEASFEGQADITIGGDITLFASGVATGPGSGSLRDGLVDAWAGIGNHATNMYSHTSLNDTELRSWRANTTSASHFALGLNVIAGESGESHITIGNIDISSEASGLLAVGGNADVSAYAYLWAVSAAASAGGDANIEIKDVDITARTWGGNDAKAYARLGEENTRHWHYSATYIDDNSPVISPSNNTYDQYTGITASILGSNLGGDFVDDYTEAKVSIEDIVLSAHVTGGEGILAEARLYGINARAGDYSDLNPANGDVTVLIDGNIDIHATASGDTGVASAILGGEYTGIEAGILGNADPGTYPGIETSSLISITGNVNITATGQGNVDAIAKLHTVEVYIGSNVEATATVHIGGDVNLHADANNGTGDAIASAEFRAYENHFSEVPPQLASIQVDGNINIDASSDGGCIDLYLGIFNTGSNVEIDVGNINVGMYGTSPDAYGNIAIIDNSKGGDDYELHFDNFFANVDVSGGQLDVSIAGVSFEDRAATFEGVGGDVNLMLSDSQVFQGIDLRNFDGQINMGFSNLTEPIVAENTPVGRLPSMFTLIFGYELNGLGHENSIVFENVEALGEFNLSGSIDHTNFLYQALNISDGNIDAALFNVSDVDFDDNGIIGDSGDTGYAFLDFTGSSIDIDDDPLTDNSTDHIGMLAYIEGGDVVGLVGLVGVISLSYHDIIQDQLVG